MAARISDKERCEKIAPLLKSLAHPQRLYILCKLRRNEMTVSELEQCCEASQPHISQHLTRMRLEGLVDSKRDGNFVQYRIVSEHVLALLESFEKVFK
ncbi:MAG: metalloregulator ArsR/SmtB family transcription factor [Bacteroidales bacterium]|nr:metalloregulator ArsR/SmtB family transcription factor [Candidatus Latescibacterota bacterium]